MYAASNTTNMLPLKSDKYVVVAICTCHISCP